MVFLFGLFHLPMLSHQLQKSNILFLSLYLILMIEIGKDLESHLQNSNRNATYVSKATQNDLLLY